MPPPPAPVHLQAAPGKPSLCLEATAAPAAPCTNVWTRTLSDGYAVGFVNNGAGTANITCDAGCFGSLDVKTGGLLVRDVWAHADVTKLVPPFTFTATVGGGGQAALFKLTHTSA